MRNVLLSFFICVAVFSYDMNDFLEAYKAKDDFLACKIGSELIQIQNNRRNETFVQTYAFACLRSDNISFASQASIYLKNSHSSRLNSALLSTIATMKKLLYLSVVDGYSIRGLEFPSVDHILGIVFNLYTSGNYVLGDDGVFTFKISDSEKITMQKKFLNGKHKLYILEYKNSELVKTHIYW